MKSITLFLPILVIFSCLIGCKKDENIYKEAQLRYNLYAPEFYSVGDTLIYIGTNIIIIDDSVYREEPPPFEAIFKIRSEAHLDSIHSLTDGMLNDVQLSTQTVYVFHAWINSRGHEFKSDEIEIFHAEKRIEFYSKIKVDDGKSSRHELFLGFLIIPKSEAEYTVFGELEVAKFKLFNSTGSKDNYCIEYSL